MKEQKKQSVQQMVNSKLKTFFEKGTYVYIYF